MAERRGARIRRGFERFLDQGLTTEVTGPLRKRVRLTNATVLVALSAMLGTIPFDYFQVGWMVWEDLAAALAFASILVLNRRGHFTASRLLCVGLCNLLAWAQAATLGLDSGADLLLVGLMALPFALFDVAEKKRLAAAVIVAAIGFVLAQIGILERFRDLPTGYVARSYHLYSALQAMLVILVTLGLLVRENARAEGALRLDIAERQRAERALAESRLASITSAKMAALGEMSANVAHEVNNPLAAILLRAQRLELLAEKDRLDVPAVLRATHEIGVTVDRIKRIVDALRFFARQADDDPARPEPLQAIVADTVELCSARFRQREIELAVDPIDSNLWIDCRGAQISQVLLNLLSNAYDAVERAPVRRVRISVETSDADVRIAVTDSGPGVPAEIEDRILEPFFTTKEIGRGTGLGLSVSKGIAEAHGGSLVHDRSLPETRFVLTVRRCPPAPGSSVR
jgi:C4-dicarboxylate-specific signal transduction histidine kinase